jgi:hypothetical protein
MAQAPIRQDGFTVRGHLLLSRNLNQRKLPFPLRALGTISLLILLVIAAMWIYRAISAQPD